MGLKVTNEKLSKILLPDKETKNVLLISEKQLNTLNEKISTQEDDLVVNLISSKPVKKGDKFVYVYPFIGVLICLVKV